MSRMFLVSLVCAVLLAPSTFAAPKPEDALMNADRDFCRAVSERRVDGWVEYMADHAAIGIGNGAPVVGKDAIRGRMQAPFSNPNFSLVWEPTRAEVFGGGTMGYTVGRWTRTVKDPAGDMVAHGTYITVWQKQKDGRWLVVADGGADDPDAQKP